MNKSLPEQSLNINILLAPEAFLGKSFVTLAAAACVLFSPLAALAVAAEGAPVDAEASLREGLRLYARLSEHLPPSQAARLASELSGAPRKALYRSD